MEMLAAIGVFVNVAVKLKSQGYMDVGANEIAERKVYKLLK